ncbi:hypothetical protein TNCV_3463091 [Trichonephila clavipes]|nr:hypothetical protein TNCV_3463091 [Trichonephila clavipes]
MGSNISEMQRWLFSVPAMRARGVREGNPIPLHTMIPSGEPMWQKRDSSVNTMSFSCRRSSDYLRRKHRSRVNEAIDALRTVHFCSKRLRMARADTERYVSICCAMVRDVVARSSTVMRTIRLSSRAVLQQVPSFLPASSDDRSTSQLPGFVQHFDLLL